MCVAPRLKGPVVEIGWQPKRSETMTKAPKNPTTNLTLASSNETPAASSKAKVAKLPAATFSPEALSKLLNELTEQRKAMALLMAEHAELKAKVDQPAKMSMAGKTEKSIKNEIAVVKAFKKAGFGNVVPHVDVMTYNRFMLAGLRPVRRRFSGRKGRLQGPI